MRTLIVLSVSLIFVMSCHAQDNRTVIAGVHEDGSMKLSVLEQNLISVIMKVKSDDHQITRAFVSEGEIPYLIGEADGFVIAYECHLENNKAYINPEGISHSCTAQKCNECAFLRSDNGSIAGCKCGDGGDQNLDAHCNHSISTPQHEIFEAIQGLQ